MDPSPYLLSGNFERVIPDGVQAILKPWDKHPRNFLTAEVVATHMQRPRAPFLFAACIKGEVELLKHIVAQGSISKEDFLNCAPCDEKIYLKGEALVEICSRGFTELLKYVVEQFELDAGDLGLCNGDIFAGMCACVDERESAAMIDLAFDLGVTVEQFVATHALHEAAFSGNVPAIRELVRRGLKPEHVRATSSHPEACCMVTPMMMAAKNGQRLALNELLVLDLTVEQLRAGGKNFLFIEACHRGWLESVVRMVQMGMGEDDVLSPLCDNLPGTEATALRLALISQDDTLGVIKYFVEDNETFPNITGATLGQYDIDVYATMVARNRVDCLRYVFRLKAIPDSSLDDATVRTLLDTACMHNHGDMVSMLVEELPPNRLHAVANAVVEKAFKSRKLFTVVRPIIQWVASQPAAMRVNSQPMALWCFLWGLRRQNMELIRLAIDGLGLAPAQVDEVQFRQEMSAVVRGDDGFDIASFLFPWFAADKPQ